MSRILIVEDEAHLAQGLQFNLEAEGHSVQVVGDGESALELLLAGESISRSAPRQVGFEAVVLDVMLPGKDGFTVSLRAARSQAVSFRSHADCPRDVPRTC